MKRPILRTALALVIGTALFTPELHAAFNTWIIDDDHPSGSPPPIANDLITDFRSIQGAVNSALVTNGDTLVVLPGNYTPTEAGGRFFITKQLEFRGANYNVNPNTAVRGAESLITGGIQLRAHNVTFNGFAFTGSPTDSSEANITQQNNSQRDNITLSNNLFNNAARFPIHHQAWFPGGVAAQNWTVTDNRINSFGSNLTLNDTGIRLADVDNAIVTGNYINAPQTESLGILVDTRNGNATISNNTILGADGFAISVASSDGSPSNITISNNTITDANLGILINGIRSAHSITDVTISNNTITGLQAGQSAPPAGILITSDVTNVNGGAALGDITITNNTLSADAATLIAGGDLIRIELGDADNPNGLIQLLNNTLTLTNQPAGGNPNVNAISLIGQLADILLTGNTLTGDGAGTVGVSMVTRDAADLYGSYPAAARIVAALNTITGFENGVEALNAFLDLYGFLPNNDVANFQSNTIAGNTTYGVVNGDSVNGGWIDARLVDWGTLSGPSSGLGFITEAQDPLTLLLALGSGDVIRSIGDPQNNNILFDSASIPEPATLALLTLMLTAPRRRRA